MTLFGYGEKKMKHKIRTLILMPLMVLLLFMGTITALPNKAHAICCTCVCACVATAHAATQNHISRSFDSHEDWMLATFWYDNVLPAMMMMTNQLSAVAMQQVQIIGAFMDAKMQLETQQLLQKLQAEAHKDYHPSEELCSIGTSVRSLAASERMGELTSAVLSKRMIDRHMRNENTVAADPSKDLEARLEQFANRFCNKRDNNGTFAVSGFCNGATNPEFHNKDIDFTRTIDIPLTLDVNFAEGNNNNQQCALGAKGATCDEIDVMAMATNLFGNDILTGTIDIGPDTANDDKDDFIDYRALLAKRSVAQNSFNTIVGMKSAGSGIGTTELKAILEELGIPNSEADEILGDNPSYYAQMELLTKKVFQNPSFYINLYDKPANVSRKGVALQALQLMLLNDTYNSNLRTEMILAVALENELDKRQEGIQGRMGSKSGASR